MEKNEVSLHEVRVFIALENLGTAWATSKEIARASAVAERTARAHLLKLSKLGIAETAEMFPAHRYQLAAKAGKRNGGYLRRLQQAREIFGL